MTVISDKKLLRIIWLAPLIVVSVFIVLVTGIMIQDNNLNVQRELKSLRSNFIEQQKIVMKSQVDQAIQQVNFEQQNTESHLKQDIKSRVHEAYDIAMNIYMQNPGKSEAVITKLVSNALRPIRFNDGRGYFFIYKVTGLAVMHPFQTKSEGTNQIDLQDVRGAFILREFNKLVKEKGESFYRWWFVKPNIQDKEFEKIGYGKHFKPYDWAIGTGEYVVDVENDIKSRLLKRFSDIRYGKDGYIFVVDSTGKMLAHFDENVRDATTYLDSASPIYKLRQDTISLAQQGGGFYEYMAPLNPSTGQPGEKISYIGKLNPWGWAIGAGVFLSEIEEAIALREAEITRENKQEIFKLLVLGMLLMISLITLSISLSRRISIRFNNLQQRIVQDFMKLEKSRNDMEHMALHDALTGLPNRVMLKEHIANGIEVSKESGKQLAVMFLDLDDFKKVNDVFGHSAGDEMLQQLGERFKSVISTTDSVSRFGGDEFIFCFPSIDGLSDAEHKVDLIRKVFANDFDIEGKTLAAKCSIGVAMYPVDGKAPEELISKADIMLYKSKSSEKGNVLFYNKAINLQVQHDFKLENELRYALARQELSILYQPQIDAFTGKICGVEALSRWSNDSLGHVSPTDFIRVAEDIGIINEIGLFVIEQACTDIANYNAIAKKPINLSINVSPKQLLDEDFAHMVYTRVMDSGLPVQMVTLEITENVLIQDSKQVMPILERLRTFGFGLSLDDFGTGYSSLSYLHVLPISEIKIDRSFIDKMLLTKQSATLVKSIIAISKSCELTLVAEGVETKEQLDKLREYQCGIIQGYYYDKPLTWEILLSRYP